MEEGAAYYVGAGGWEEGWKRRGRGMGGGGSATSCVPTVFAPAIYLNHVQEEQTGLGHSEPHPQPAARKSHRRRLTDYLSQIPEGVLMPHNSTEDFCGDSPGEVCVCDELLDGAACVGGLAYPPGAAFTNNFYPAPASVAIPCPDFTDIYGLLKSLVHSRTGNHTLTEEEKMVHMTTVESAGLRKGSSSLDFRMLSPFIRRLYEELIARPCAPQQFFDDFEAAMTLRWHPPDLAELQTLCEQNIIVKCALTTADLARRSFVDSVYEDGAAPELMAGKDALQNARPEKFSFSRLSDFASKACEEPSVATDPDYCRKVKQVQDNMHNSCPEGSAGRVYAGQQISNSCPEGSAGRVYAGRHAQLLSVGERR